MTLTVFFAMIAFVLGCAEIIRSEEKSLLGWAVLALSLIVIMPILFALF